MKYCSSCHTEYSDDTLQFCLQDGTRLAFGAVEAPNANLGESETVISPRGEKLRFEIPDATIENSPANRVTNVPAVPVAPKTNNTAKIVALTMFGMLLLFGAIGAGAWFLLKKKQPEIAQNTNTVPNTNNGANVSYENELNKNAAARRTPTPKPPVNSSVSNVFSNNEKSEPPPPPLNREQIESEVSDSLEKWKSQSESGDLDAYMNSYADTVDYYKKSGASRSFVRNDKQRAFSRFDSISFNLSNVSITPDASGERATAVFDKEWEFLNNEKASSGKVRQQLLLKKIGGKWLITGEKDLKVYYLE